MSDTEDREAALACMMRAHGSALLRMAFLYLRDAALAEDAAQEAFLKAYLRFDTFRGESSEKTWLTRILINVCRDMNRSAWARFVDRRRPLDSLPEQGAEDAPRDDDVLTEVMRLKASDREIILLRFYQDMKLGDIAKCLSIPEATAASRLLRAKKKLRKRLEGWELDG